MPHRKSINVLVVDDDSDDQILVADTLLDSPEANYSIRTASTIEQANEILYNSDVDVILCDYRLGPVNGVQYIQSLRENGSEIPFVLLTGEDQPNIDQKGLEAGASDFISKHGYNIQILDKSIRYAIANADRQRIAQLKEKELAQQKILEAALTDELTKLPNRSALNFHLDDLIRSKEVRSAQTTIFLVNIKSFKSINDVYGIDVGDRILFEAGERIRAVADKECFVARLGGDEFVVVDPRPDIHLDHGSEAARIVDAFASPFVIDGHALSVGVNVGVAFMPAHGRTRQEILAKADAALGRAKVKPDGSVCLYDPDIDSEVRRSRALAFDLHDAVASGDIDFVFQPQLSMESGEIVGFETLARWTHPKRGQVSPGQFVQIAESTGTIIPLGEQALFRACRAAMGWNKPYRVAVNVSPVQISHVDLPEVVGRVLAETGLPPERLELEITETALMDDVGHAQEVLGELKALGVTIALDDFGAGYSSLSALHVVPVDRIKIDRSFIRDVDRNPQTQSIYHSILQLSLILHLSVIAEGIESPSQLEFLLDAGCDEVQGFLIGEPDAQATWNVENCRIVRQMIANYRDREFARIAV